MSWAFQVQGEVASLLLTERTGLFLCHWTPAAVVRHSSRKSLLKGVAFPWVLLSPLLPIRSPFLWHGTGHPKTSTQGLSLATEAVLSLCCSLLALLKAMVYEVLL